MLDIRVAQAVKYNPGQIILPNQRIKQAGDRTLYGEYLNVFKTEIPQSIRIAEASASGQSIFEYDPKGKAMEALGGLVREIIEKKAMFLHM